MERVSRPRVTGKHAKQLYAVRSARNGPLIMASGTITSKLLRAIQTLNRLMSHRPKSAAIQYMDALLLLAATAGNGHNGIGLF